MVQSPTGSNQLITSERKKDVTREPEATGKGSQIRTKEAGRSQMLDFFSTLVPLLYLPPRPHPFPSASCRMVFLWGNFTSSLFRLASFHGFPQHIECYPNTSPNLQDLVPADFPRHLRTVSPLLIYSPFSLLIHIPSSVKSGLLSILFPLQGSLPFSS